MTGEFLRTDAFLEYPDPVNGITKQARQSVDWCIYMCVCIRWVYMYLYI